MRERKSNQFLGGGLLQCYLDKTFRKVSRELCVPFGEVGGRVQGLGMHPLGSACLGSLLGVTEPQVSHETLKRVVLPYSCDVV